MAKAKIIGGLIACFITIPIWFFLLYRVLLAVQATELMWFLYWIYVPFSIIVNIINQVATKA